MTKEDFKESTKHLHNQRFPTFCQMLHDVRMIKYARLDQIQSINKEYKKLISKAKIKHYLDLNLMDKRGDVLIVTNEAKDLLCSLGQYSKLLLPEDIVGNGDVNELNNTDVFIKALNFPDFKTLLYPNFEYLIPDALMVRAKGNSYKLEFLEIEAYKSDWENVCRNKRSNYIKLATEPTSLVYRYWCRKCDLLGLDKPSKKDFKFSVTFIGSLSLDFGKGFKFTNTLE